MSQTLLQQLQAMTVVVADTGDLDAIRQHTPRDATTNPSLVTQAAQRPEYGELVDGALRWAQKRVGSARVVPVAIDRLAVDLGLRILELVPGRVSTEVDARLSYDAQGTVEKARWLVEQYEAGGASRERVLIKIAATWQGIRAAEVLEKERIHCNLTLLFGLHQAAACADAGVTLISPFVGRILDWYKQETGRDYGPEDDPGVASVRTIYTYFKKHGYRTEVMGASFRNVGQILALAGCDLLTIAPPLLANLASGTGTLQRALSPEAAEAAEVEKLEVDATAFQQLHARDRMASEKLAEGIQGFSKALVALERLMTERLRALDGQTRVGEAARQFFKVYDLDGDGFITREEWGGSDMVFQALDTDGDGRISPEELATGLGAAFHLGVG